MALTEGKVRFGPDAVGCYLDGHFGPEHNLYRIVTEVAVPAGFVLSAEDEVLVECFAIGEAEDDLFEAVAGQGGISDEALEWLNTSGVTAPDLYWEWVDGELFLTADEGEL